MPLSFLHIYIGLGAPALSVIKEKIAELFILYLSAFIMEGECADWLVVNSSLQSDFTVPHGTYLHLTKHTFKHRLESIHKPK
jgi:hypothetical protein